MVVILQVYKSRRNRAGVGKMRNRRRVQRKGPLIVYSKDQVAIIFNFIFFKIFCTKLSMMS